MQISHILTITVMHYYAQTLAFRTETERAMLTIMQAHDAAMETGRLDLMRRLDAISEHLRSRLHEADMELKRLNNASVRQYVVMPPALLWLN